MSQPVLDYSSLVVPPRWARWLLNPIGWPYFSLMVIACAGVLWECRVPEPFGAWIVAVVLVAPSFGILLLLRLVLRLILWRIYRRPWRAFVEGLWRFGVPVGVGLILWGLLYLKVPEKVAWRISEPALRRHAQRLITTEAARVPPATAPAVFPHQWVGLYPMYDITYFPDVRGVRYFIAGSGFLDQQGFAYLPGGAPAVTASVRAAHYAPFDGDWYRVRELW